LNRQSRIQSWVWPAWPAATPHITWSERLRELTDEKNEFIGRHESENEERRLRL
jgi:hypothetical protein